MQSIMCNVRHAKGVIIFLQKQKENHADTDNDELGDLCIDKEDDDRFSFLRSIHVDTLALES